MIREYESTKATISDANKIKLCTAHPGQKTWRGRGAGTKTPAASNRASLSVAHITRAVPNIRFMTRLPFTAHMLLYDRRGELPFWSLSSVFSLAWKMVSTSAV